MIRQKLTVGLIASAFTLSLSPAWAGQRDRARGCRDGRVGRAARQRRRRVLPFSAVGGGSSDGSTRRRNSADRQLDGQFAVQPAAGRTAVRSVAEQHRVVAAGGSGQRSGSGGGGDRAGTARFRREQWQHDSSAGSNGGNQRADGNNRVMSGTASARATDGSLSAPRSSAADRRQARRRRLLSRRHLRPATTPTTTTRSTTAGGGTPATGARMVTGSASATSRMIRSSSADMAPTAAPTGTARMDTIRYQGRWRRLRRVVSPIGLSRRRLDASQSQTGQRAGLCRRLLHGRGRQLRRFVPEADDRRRGHKVEVRAEGTAGRSSTCMVIPGRDDHLQGRAEAELDPFTDPRGFSALRTAPTPVQAKRFGRPVASFSGYRPDPRPYCRF